MFRGLGLGLGFGFRFGNQLAVPGIRELQFLQSEKQKLRTCREYRLKRSPSVSIIL